MTKDEYQLTVTSLLEKDDGQRLQCTFYKDEEPTVIKAYKLKQTSAATTEKSPTVTDENTGGSDTDGAQCLTTSMTLAAISVMLHGLEL